MLAFWSAVIFDHDGTLVDTVGPDYRACLTLFEECGQVLCPTKWGVEACGRVDGYDRLFSGLIESESGLTRGGLWSRLQELWDEFLTVENVRLLPGSRRLVAALHADGVPLGVASAASRAWARRWLEHFEMDHYFKVVTTRESVARNKPHPDIYLETARRLGANPADCLVFEDSQAGVTAASRAGMTVVAVPTEYTRGLDYSHADAVLTDLSEASIGLLGDLYATARRFPA